MSGLAERSGVGTHTYVLCFGNVTDTWVTFGLLDVFQ